jgi:putative peptidoglycan lipid II flippase
MMVCALGGCIALGFLITYGVQYWWCDPASRWVVAMPLLRIMLPYALLICLAAIVSAVLNIHERFAISSLTPVILNIFWLIALVGLCPFLPEEGMWRMGAVSLGILVAGVGQILFQLPELRRVGYRFRLSLKGWGKSAHVRQVLLQMGPASLGIALAQVNICMDGWLTFYGAEWAPAVLEYADRIIYLPLGLFGTAFATVLLPMYAKQYTAGAMGEVLSTFTSALKQMFIVMAPMALGLCALAAPTVSLIYERGAFNADSVLWTARAVAAYAPGLLVFSAAKTVIPIFYAQKDVKTPVTVASWCILGNFTCNLLSVLFLPEGWRHVGIALSTVLNSILNTAILLVILRRRGLKVQLWGVGFTLVKTLLAAGLMAAAAAWTFYRLQQWVPMGIAYLGAVMVAPCVYIPLLWLLARQELMAFLADAPFIKRFYKKRA